MSSYRQALKTARTEYIRKLIDNHQNNPRFLFSTVARLTNKQMSPDLNIPSQCNSNDFMNFFTDKIDNIRNTITNVDSTASSTSASFIAPKEKLHCFTTIGQDELNKLITASKPTTCLLDPVPTKLLKELLPVAEEPLLNIINSSLSLGHIPKPFKLAVIKPLIKKPKLDPCELANYRPISVLLDLSAAFDTIDKTEILLIGPKNSTQNLLDYNLQLDGCTVTFSTVKNMGVILDSKLSFENHISNVTKTAFFHLRNIAKLRNMLSVSDAEKLVHAFMTSRLDYCNALLGGCPVSSINKLQIVQNSAARVLTRSRKYDHITPILQSLHWLPIKFRISYKILLLAYKALNDLAPAYLTNLLSRYNPTRSLRSQNSGLLVVPRIAKSTKGGRTFSYLAPKLWNSLPDNVRGSDTLSLFKSRLKTHLFSQAFI